MRQVRRPGAADACAARPDRGRPPRLSVGALAAFAQIAALYLVAGVDGHDQPDAVRLGARRLHVPGVAVLAVVRKRRELNVGKLDLTPRAPGSCPRSRPTPGVLVDPTCPICIEWNDGDPACPKHGGTYKEGLVCPATKDLTTWRSACQRGAAYVCFTCEDAAEGAERTTALPIPGEGRRATVPAVGYPWRRRLT